MCDRGETFEEEGVFKRHRAVMGVMFFFFWETRTDDSQEEDIIINLVSLSPPLSLSLSLNSDGCTE